jgi:hypothetical protein
MMSLHHLVGRHMQDRAFLIALMLIGMLAILLMYVVAAAATDYGQWKDYHLTEQERQWFKSLEVPRAEFHALCCDIADGYPMPNAEKEEDGHYWITFYGSKYKVPSVAVIHNTPNPIGVPIVWLSTMEDRVTGIRCFLPESES